MIDQSFSDTLENVESTFSVFIPDTVKILDTAYYLTQPIFWLSIASIFIAFTALVYPLIHRYFRKKKQKATFEKYVMYLLRELSNSIESRIPQIAAFASNLHDIQSGSIGYSRNLMHTAKTLSDIDQKDLYNIFINNKKSKIEEDFSHYKSILDAIEFFIKHDEDGRNNFVKFFDDLRRYQSDFKKNLGDILRSFDRNVATNKRNKISISNDEFFKEENNIINDWRFVDNRYHYFVTRDVLLIPLKKHALANITDERAVQMIESIIKCNDALSDIINIREVYGTTFDSVIATMKKMKNNLNKAINHFKNRDV